MRVGVFLTDAIDPSLGGNFSYHQKFVDAVDQHNFNSRIEIFFVGRVSKSKMKLRKEYVKISSRFPYLLFRILDKLGITQFFILQTHLNVNLANIFDRYVLKKSRIDILVYPKQFLKEVENFPFITMNWDAGHKTTFAFPELLENFNVRESWYSVEIQKAISVFVESQSSKEEFCAFYKIPEKKIEVIPLFPGGVIDIVVEESKQTSILNEFGIGKQNYFYYPAQFWAHKNHYILIHAFKKLIDNNVVVKLIFSGSDKGNKGYINSLIAENGLESHIIVKGFISNEEVYTLYKNALALVMPTYLGPTNMPLLEAQALGSAIICSDLLGHRETCGDGALYIDPTNSEEWHEAMLKVLDNDFRALLIARSNQIRSSSQFNIESALRAFEDSLIKLIPIRKSFL